MENNKDNMSTEEVLSSIRNLLNKGEEFEQTPLLEVFDLSENMIVSEGKKIETAKMAEQIVQKVVAVEKSQNININSEEIAGNIIKSFAKMFEGVKSFKMNEVPISKDINNIDIENIIKTNLEKQVKDWLDNNVSEILKTSISKELEKNLGRGL